MRSSSKGSRGYHRPTETTETMAKQYILVKYVYKIHQRMVAPINRMKSKASV